MPTERPGEPTPSYEMFTKAGDRACHAIVKAALRLPLGSTDADIYKLVRERMKKLQSKHPEINDSEPGGHIVFRIGRATGRSHLSRFEL